MKTTSLNLCLVASTVLFASGASAGTERNCSSVFSNARSGYEALYKPLAAMSKWHLSAEAKVEHFKKAVDQDNQSVIMMIGEYHDFNHHQLIHHLTKMIDDLMPYAFPQVERLSENSLEWWSFPKSHEVSRKLTSFGFVDSRGSKDEYVPRLTADILKMLAYYRGFYPFEDSKHLRSKTEVPISLSRETAQTLLLNDLLYLFRIHGVMGAIGPVQTAHSNAFVQLRLALTEDNLLQSLENASWYSTVESFDKVQKLAAESEAQSTAAVKKLASLGTFNVIKGQSAVYGTPVIWPMALLKRIAKAKTSGTSRREQTPADVVEHFERLISAKRTYDRVMIADKMSQVFGNSLDSLGRSSGNERSEARIQLYSLLHPLFLIANGPQRQKIDDVFFKQIGWLKSEANLLELMLTLYPGQKFTKPERQAFDLLALRRAVQEL